LIGETYVGMDHDHFFSFRLDFDLDGTANCFLREKLQLQHLPAETFRNSVRVAKPDVAKTQGQAKAHRSMDNPESWLVANPNVKNCLGDPVGYARMGGENPMSLMLTEDYSQRRAGFTDDPI
jgi:primary-amine oxidase